MWYVFQVHEEKKSVWLHIEFNFNYVYLIFMLQIKEITFLASLPDYVNNDNDQSVVEICITRYV